MSKFNGSFSKKDSLPSPRNPFVEHVVARNGDGVHEKDKTRASRREQKLRLKLNKYDDSDYED